MKETRRNDDIFAPQVRVVDAEGEQAGIMGLEETKALALEASMDLVEIAPNAGPPVCRIMDWGKYRFEEAKKGQASKKKQKLSFKEQFALENLPGEIDLITGEISALERQLTDNTLYNN